MAAALLAAGLAGVLAHSSDGIQGTGTPQAGIQGTGAPQGANTAITPDGIQGSG
jgi:hypothetical protein